MFSLTVDTLIKTVIKHIYFLSLLDKNDVEILFRTSILW